MGCVKVDDIVIAQRAAMRIVRHVQDAEDCAAAAAAYQLGRGEANPRFLCHNSKQRGIDVLRRRQNWRTVEIPIGLHAGDEMPALVVRDLMSRVGRDRGLCEAVWLGGVSYVDAGRMFRIPIGTVRSRISRRKADMRRILEAA